MRWLVLRRNSRLLRRNICAINCFNYLRVSWPGGHDVDTAGQGTTVIKTTCGYLGENQQIPLLTNGN